LLIVIIGRFPHGPARVYGPELPPTNLSGATIPRVTRFLKVTGTLLGEIDDAFDPAELIEDFEHPICTSCLGVGWVRDSNGIEMIRCEGCEGVGRAPSY
jgi:hypothetical protein